MNIAVAGAGIYGSTIAIYLAREGHRVNLFDPLGVIQAATAINQYRIHRGYHYPRSPETIAEILAARAEFIDEYREAIFFDAKHFYAIPLQGSLTTPEEFETVCRKHGLPLEPTTLPWIDSKFIDRCYAVDEQVYDPLKLRALIVERIEQAGITFSQNLLSGDEAKRFDAAIFATYGTYGTHAHLFENSKVQVAEKILIQLPYGLRNIGLVVIDGPFTAFDPYGASGCSLFGSAKHTNHWSTNNPDEAVPKMYRRLLNKPNFTKIDFSNFGKMVEDGSRAVPEVREAEYLGSRFTLRVVENDPVHDRRTFRIIRKEGNLFYVFSGKVVSAINTAKLICKQLRQSGCDEVG